MNLGENIYNAFEVVNKTHENISKLIDYCKVISVEKKEFDLMSPKFLRYKSDADYLGWNTGQFFLLFQDTSDELLDNEWRNGPIYVLEITLYDPNAEILIGPNEPWIELLKFEYDDIQNFSSGVSPASYKYFYRPIFEVDYKEMEDETYFADMPDDISKQCLGVKRVVSKFFPLVSINYENAYEKIFGTFKSLKDK